MTDRGVPRSTRRPAQRRRRPRRSPPRSSANCVAGQGSARPSSSPSAIRPCSWRTSRPTPQLDEPALRARLASVAATGVGPPPVPDLERTAPQSPRQDRPSGLCRTPAPRHAERGRPDSRPNVADLVDTVLATWTASIGRDDIGLDTDFFDVGGDSLAAVEIVSRLGDELGREVRIGELLAAPTPRSLALALAPTPDRSPDRRRGHVAWARSMTGEEFRVVTLRQGHDDGAVVVMTPAWDDVFGYQAFARSFPDEVTVLALVYEEVADRPLVTTVDELVTGSIDLVRVDGRRSHAARRARLVGRRRRRGRARRTSPAVGRTHRARRGGRHVLPGRAPPPVVEPLVEVQVDAATRSVRRCRPRVRRHGRTSGEATGRPARAPTGRLVRRGGARRAGPNVRRRFPDRGARSPDHAHRDADDRLRGRPRRTPDAPWITGGGWRTP